MSRPKLPFETKSLNVTLSKANYDFLQELNRDTGSSMSSLVRMILYTAEKTARGL